jgi:hypothetical protein
MEISNHTLQEVDFPTRREGIMTTKGVESEEDTGEEEEEGVKGGEEAMKVVKGDRSTKIHGSGNIKMQSVLFTLIWK